MKAFYPGSFDPFTNGHLHIVKKVATMFASVIVGIGVNPKKNRSYDVDKVKSAMEETFKREKLNNVSVVVYSGLTSKIAQKENTDYLVRGIRNGTDYAYEEEIAIINEKISGIDTIYYRAQDMNYISSSMVKELFYQGEDVSEYVPAETLNLMKNAEKE